jgi:acyl-CoA synthetase (AMP-forming)/AMP-acid ligase II
VTNLARNLTDTTRVHAGRVAVRVDNAAMTYRALDEASARVAGLLHERGLRPGDRVGIMMPNVAEVPVVYYGVLRAGGVVVPMNPLLKAREVAYYLGDSGADTVVVGHRLRGRAHHVRGAAAPAQPRGGRHLLAADVHLRRCGSAGRGAARVRGGVRRPGAGGIRPVVDRKKDLIIRGGYNVYPREIEEVLYEHPAVAEAAVIGLPDASLGEEVGAAVALKPGASVTAEELRDYVKGQVAAYKYPRHVWIVDALPKGGTGKIQKRDIVIPADLGAP